MLGDDTGAQPERTALAWQRTALSCAMIALVAAFGAIRIHQAVLVLAVTAVAVAVVINLFRGFPTGAMPGSGMLHSWPILRRMAVQSLALALLGAFMAVMRLAS